MMKKAVSYIITLLLSIVLLSANVFAENGNYQPGDILGDVLYSDIVAYINGQAIPTSIKDGTTMVVAEDLRNYGFDIVWDAASWALYITPDMTKVYEPLTVERNTMPVGSFKCHYVYTTIKTYLSGELVDSYAIDGRTLIDFELLVKYGTIDWDGNTRELRLSMGNTNPITKPTEVNNPITSAPVLVEIWVLENMVIFETSVSANELKNTFPEGMPYFAFYDDNTVEIGSFSDTQNYNDETLTGLVEFAIYKTNGNSISMIDSYGNDVILVRDGDVITWEKDGIAMRFTKQ